MGVVDGDVVLFCDFPAGLEAVLWFGDVGEGVDEGLDELLPEEEEAEAPAELAELGFHFFEAGGCEFDGCGFDEADDFVFGSFDELVEDGCGAEVGGGIEDDDAKFGLLRVFLI